MRLYIDPGTGSMLFAILIGAIGVARFVLKGVFVKLKFLFTGGRQTDTDDDTIPLVIFSDDRRYWQTFEPVVRELDSRSFDVRYMTASPDDPALKSPLPHLHAEFIGEGNKAFAKLNFLKATVLLSTTPGLDVYQWKRSRDVRYYVHLPHGANDATTGYRSFGLDFYDAVLLSGKYQETAMRKLEQLRGEAEKEAVLVGVPYMDEMVRRLAACPELPPHPRTVLVAPTWGASSIFSKYGAAFIDALLQTGYHVILRPHPQSFTADKELMDTLMSAFPDSDNFDKPVICADTEMNVDPLDAWWLGEPLWAVTALPRIGPRLTADRLGDLKALIDSAIDDPSYTASRHEARNETWMYPGEGSSRVADYLLAKYTELTRVESASSDFAQSYSS